MSTYYTLQNGTLQQTSNMMDDRGLAYGDGFFSTLGVRGGRILWLDLHKQRFNQGAKQLALTLDVNNLANQLNTLAGDITDGIIKVIITRQAQAVRGYGFVDNTAVIHIKSSAMPIYQDVSFISDFPIQAPMQASCLSAQVGIRPPRFAGLKLISSHEQIFAHQELLQKQITNPALGEGLVTNVDKLWISGTMSNVYYRLDDAWYTPFVDKSGVNGVARQAVLAMGQVSQRHLKDDDLPHITGLFFSNAVRGIMPVQGLWLDDVLISLNPDIYKECFT